jgi:hypothetical protein
MDGMPADLQFLEADKEREPREDIRVALVESLVLLGTTKEGRQVLRDRKAVSVPG